jgi:hypothetical protein
MVEQAQETDERCCFRREGVRTKWSAAMLTRVRGEEEKGGAAGLLIGEAAPVYDWQCVSADPKLAVEELPGRPACQVRRLSDSFAERHKGVEQPGWTPQNA